MSSLAVGQLTNSDGSCMSRPSRMMSVNVCSHASPKRMVWCGRRDVPAGTVGGRMASNLKHVNHELSPMGCPERLDDVDLFGVGAQEHWYEAYEILHRDAPVLRIEGGGLTPGSDAFVLTKHADTGGREIGTDALRFLADNILGLLLGTHKKKTPVGSGRFPVVNLGVVGVF